MLSKIENILKNNIKLELGAAFQRKLDISALTALVIQGLIFVETFLKY